MKKLGKIATELPDGLYYIKDGAIYEINIQTFPCETITIPPYTVIDCDGEIQHVGYDDAQLGREK